MFWFKSSYSNNEGGECIRSRRAALMTVGSEVAAKDSREPLVACQGPTASR
nr:DUF397 domain-containing protein [Streptomyces sp. SID5466]